MFRIDQPAFEAMARREALQNLKSLPPDIDQEPAYLAIYLLDRLKEDDELADRLVDLFDVGSSWHLTPNVRVQPRATKC